MDGDPILKEKNDKINSSLKWMKQQLLVILFLLAIAIAVQINILIFYKINDKSI